MTDAGCPSIREGELTLEGGGSPSKESSPNAFYVTETAFYWDREELLENSLSLTCPHP